MYFVNLHKFGFIFPICPHVRTSKVINYWRNWSYIRRKDLVSIFKWDIGFGQHGPPTKVTIRQNWQKVAYWPQCLCLTALNEIISRRFSCRTNSWIASEDLPRSSIDMAYYTIIIYHLYQDNARMPKEPFDTLFSKLVGKNLDWLHQAGGFCTWCWAIAGFWLAWPSAKLDPAARTRRSNKFCRLPCQRRLRHFHYKSVCSNLSR